MLFSQQIARVRGQKMILTNSFSCQHLASGTTLYPDRQRKKNKDYCEAMTCRIPDMKEKADAF